MKKYKLFLFGLITVLFLAGTVYLITSATFAKDSDEVQRAYFRILNPQGEKSVLNYVRHDFPGQVVSVQANVHNIEALKENPNLEFRGYASKWELVPIGQALDGRGGVSGPTGKPYCGDGKCNGGETQATCPGDCGGGGGRVCYLSDYGLDQVQYGMKQLYQDPNLTQTSGGAGVNVAVLDTGAKTTHPDISQRIQKCRDATSTRIKNSCADNNGHGTNVASIIAADAGADGLGIYGVAPAANLWIYKVCGAYCWSDDVARALYELTDQGANVVNMSFGGSGLASDEKAALDYAYGKGVLLVAAAGNSGPGADTIGYPAAYIKVMGIAAIDSSYATADFSSRGVNDGDYVIEEREIEMAAAGVKVLGAYKNGCYAWYWGTSQASPHVAGLAAKLWQGSGIATRTYLQNRAKLYDLNGAGDDTQTGFGLPTVP